MGMNDLNLLLAQFGGKAPELNDEIAIVKACERIGCDLNGQEVDLVTEDASRVQAGHLDVIVAAFQEQPGELDGLRLRAALMKAADEL